MIDKPTLLGLDISQKMKMSDEEFRKTHNNQWIKIFQRIGRHVICDGCNKSIVGKAMVKLPSDDPKRLYDDLDINCFKRIYLSKRNTLTPEQIDYYDRVERLFW